MKQKSDSLWNTVWEAQVGTVPERVFSHYLFIEGYPVLRSLIPPSARAILETGTGGGRYGAALAHDFPAAHVTATDIVPASLESAALLKTALGLRNLSVEYADVLKLPYVDESFDLVFSDTLIQHVPDDMRAVSEMARVLAPGGILIVTSVNRYSLHALVRFVQRIFGRPYRYGFERLYTRRMFRTLSLEAGLTVVREDGFYPAYGIYRLKRFWRGFGLLGKAINRVTRALDALTGRWVSRTFGFELVFVLKKPYHPSYGRKE